MNQLHFLHPLWLLALFPLALLWWFTVHSKIGSSKAWEKVIDPKLLPLLLSGSDENHKLSESYMKWGLAFIWFIATIALADPVWEKIPRPVFQTNSARVIVLDLSNSMKIADLKPSRIARARFKIEDILSRQKKEEGQIGLVLFAGDAFTASPLTRDVETIRSLVQVLDPEIMPSQGSRVDLGLKKAHELLRQAGIHNGQVLLIADGVSNQKLALKAAKALRKDGHTISVLGVGTEIGGVLPQIKYQNGDRIKVALDTEFLEEIAQAGGGKYHLITTNNTDLKTVLSKSISKVNAPKEKNEDVKSEDWKSTGPFILLLLLPLAALAFRRGWLFNIVIAASLFSLLQPQPVLASPLTDSISEGWSKLWINKEQQAEIALKKQQYDEAKKLSDNPLMRGTANYKKQNYNKALEEFKQVDSADAHYNEGNALANLEKYKEAIIAYEKALKLQPDMEDAKKNKATVEQLLKKKQEQEQKKKDNQKSSDKNSDKNKDGKKDQKKGSSNNSKSKDNKDNKQNKKNKDGKKGQNKNDQKSNDQDSKKDEKNKAGKKNEQKSKNQFADANKNLDKPKPKEAEESKQAKKNNEAEQKDSANKKADEKTNKPKENADKKAKKPTKQEKPDKKGEIKKGQKGSKIQAEELSKEEKMAAEQWLRRIPDDPGGLLRRKFKYQYQQRRRSINETEQPW